MHDGVGGNLPPRIDFNGGSKDDDRGRPRQENKDGLREIVETVVFVVVLVLLLKSFVAEAFVIPTGSMAETLLGYHKPVTCPKCGYEFPVNCSSEVDPQRGGPPTPVVDCVCPNCRYFIDFATHHLDPSWKTGDRVLVGKFLYDFDLFGKTGPHRFDVVVFKYPQEPQRDYTPLNYIKRLVGLPGETIAIYYGNLYRNEGLLYDDVDLSNVSPQELWNKDYMYRDDKRAMALFQEGKFQILHKAPKEILSERRIVYDNDHQALDLVGKVPPRWAADEEKGQGWTPQSPKLPLSFNYAAPESHETSWLHYSHLMPDDRRQKVRKELITDFMGYNTWNTGPELRSRHAMPAPNWVGDLLLECDVDVKQAQGTLTLALSRGPDRFQARWDLATGTCSLIRLSNGKEEVLNEAQTSVKKAGSYRLRLANFDERLTVWVDNHLPFGDGIAYPPSTMHGPTENDLQPASIGALGTSLNISKIKLWRDTYYTSRTDPGQGDAGGGDIDMSDPQRWDPLRSDIAPTTMYVQPGHYLCLGDNSPESSDGRTWGLVPKRLLLGRALLVYFPFSRMGRIQ